MARFAVDPQLTMALGQHNPHLGVRAVMPAFGSDELLDLELYLAQRATGLNVETPGVRR